MPKYKVWIAQVNQQMFEVTAKSQEEAERKAIKQYKKENPSTVVDIVSPRTTKDNMQEVLNRSNWSDATI